MSGITPDEIAAYQRDGAVCVRGLFRDWVDVIEAGIERNIREPGPYAAESVRPGEPGSFFDDYCNWERIPELRRVVLESPAAQVAAAAMRSRTAQFFHDHVLVKEPGTQKATPWHQDIPYYFVDGAQTVSIWIPIDPVRDATLRVVAGSHRWDRPILPVRWLDNGSFYPGEGDYRPVPDPD
ncbi:MAG: phytanoyl-CoA dioxygenase family protein, partial [Actinomycetes bacterium]